MHKTINGKQLQEMLIFGAASIAKEKQHINDLNVFPVPDGDTGTNMSLTIQAAAEELKKRSPGTVELTASIAASALLRGARGNSGVILSLLFRGMSKSFKGAITADGEAFAAALQEGVSSAYNAVMKPAEGTILTVSRLASDRAMSASSEDNSIEYVLEQAIKQGEETLKETVNMNPVLKKAGVVDAGGKGYLVILKGMLSYLRGEPMPEAEDDDDFAVEKADFAAIGEEDITFDFDTVFIVRKTVDKPLDELRAYLNSIGDSLVIGEDDESFKVHVHTDTPGDALNEAQKYGTLELAKIENMRTQAQDLAAGRKAQSTDDLEDDHAAPTAPAEPPKPFGFLTVCAGEGLAAVFSDLGADGIVSGGQTMNPSTESILTVVEQINAETVFILPNNKNIVMAAQQCEALTEKNVIVIPTATVPQGIAAMMAIDPSETEAGALERAMLTAASNVATAQITYAARNSDFDGFAINEGDYLALLDGKLFGTDKDIVTLIKSLAANATEREAEFINIFYGEDVSEEDAAATEALFAELCPGAEISLLPGGQPVYYYIISME
ncbi:MAG: DAK2 domain-containing protein [Oscillospiraceae bacterium]|nr:DAK2 domain-containing protein [Oscillospiraceae bacterium]